MTLVYTYIYICTNAYSTIIKIKSHKHVDPLGFNVPEIQALVWGPKIIRKGLGVPRTPQGPFNGALGFRGQDLGEYPDPPRPLLMESLWPLIVGRWGILLKGSWDLVTRVIR